MVEIDFQIAIFSFGIAKGVFHLDLRAINLGKVVVPHGNSIVSMDRGGCILKADLGPGMNSKTMIFAVFGIAAYKI